VVLWWSKNRAVTSALEDHGGRVRMAPDATLEALLARVEEIAATAPAQLELVEPSATGHAGPGRARASTSTWTRVPRDQPCVGEANTRVVPLALAQLARDFGWSSCGRNLARLALALDRLRDTAITLRVWARGERAPGCAVASPLRVGDPGRHAPHAAPGRSPHLPRLGRPPATSSNDPTNQQAVTLTPHDTPIHRP
jgi:hypothetical protein